MEKDARQHMLEFTLNFRKGQGETLPAQRIKDSLEGHKLSRE